MSKSTKKVQQRSYRGRTFGHSGGPQSGRQERSGSRGETVDDEFDLPPAQEPKGPRIEMRARPQFDDDDFAPPEEPSEDEPLARSMERPVDRQSERERPIERERQMERPVERPLEREVFPRHRPPGAGVRFRAVRPRRRSAPSMPRRSSVRRSALPSVPALPRIRAMPRRAPPARRAANDDRQSIGQLLAALQRRPSPMPYVVAAGASIGWLIIGGLLAAAHLRVAELGASEMLSSPALLTIIAGLIVPPIFFFVLGGMVSRTPEMRIVAHSTGAGRRPPRRARCGGDGFCRHRRRSYPPRGRRHGRWRRAHYRARRRTRRNGAK